MRQNEKEASEVSKEDKTSKDQLYMWGKIIKAKRATESNVVPLEKLNKA